MHPLPVIIAIAALVGALVTPTPAAAQDDVQVTLTLLSFQAVEDPDPTLGQGAGDFSAEISFGDGSLTTTSGVEDHGPFTAPDDWTLTTTVDRDAQATLSATVRIFDGDAAIAGPDDEMDLDPTEGELPLDLTIDLSDGSWTGDTLPNTGIVEGNGDTDETGTFEGGEIGRLWFAVGLGASADIDDDGIPDSVERFGIPDLDGSLHTDMAALGADPCRKTIAIEIDWLSIGGSDDLRPKAGALDEAIDMFDAAPIPAVDCPYAGFPTNPSGANMIIDVDSPIDWDAADIDEPFNLGDLQDQRATDFDDARDQYFFYSVWGYTHDGTSSSGVCCNAKGFMVTLGKWTDAGSVRQQAGTLVHELGHNLGLGHGGGDGTNYKPNYLSVMNYRYQTRGLVDWDAWVAAGGGNSSYVPNATIDFSRTALPSLDESSLDESAGIGGFGTAAMWRDPADDLQVGDARGPLDYNDDDDTTDSGLTIDLNEDGPCVTAGDDETLDTDATNDDVVARGQVWSGPDGTCDSAAEGDDEQVTSTEESPPTDDLDGHDDWSTIVFAGEINAGLGGNTGPLTDVEEITFEEHLRQEEELVEAANQAPTADAGPDVSVEEGHDVTVDGSGSSDPDGDDLTFEWSPADQLDDPTSATPTYTGLDDDVQVLTLTVTDPLGLSDSDTVEVTTTNVDPEVSATGDSIDEAGTATVSATFTDPGTVDTHSAIIDWGDGTSDPVTVVQQAGSGSLVADHVYGDDGDYTVTVTVTDDDDGTDEDVVTASVANLDPTVELGTGEVVTFPGGDAAVTQQGAATDESAEASDEGSDDLTFAWGFGPSTTYYNDGTAPDPPLSPLGSFPFTATDSQAAAAPTIGVSSIDLTVTDDDGGTATDALTRIVTGTDDDTEGSGFWRTEYRQRGRVATDTDALLGYLEIIRFVSTTFAEDVPLTTLDDAAAVLSPRGNDPRARARADLLVAWLHFASGAAAVDGQITTGGLDAGYLDVLDEIEGVITDPTSTRAELIDASQKAQQTRHTE